VAPTMPRETFPEALDATRNVRRLPRRSHLHSRANFKGLWLRF